MTTYDELCAIHTPPTEAEIVAAMHDLEVLRAVSEMRALARVFPDYAPAAEPARTQMCREQTAAGAPYSCPHFTELARAASAALSARRWLASIEALECPPIMPWAGVDVPLEFVEDIGFVEDRGYYRPDDERRHEFYDLTGDELRGLEAFLGEAAR